MKQIRVNRRWAVVFGAVLALPGAYFILIALLKYAFGIPYLFDTAQPLLERLGIKESMGGNINLLILFGPLIALGLNIISVLRIEYCNEKDFFSVKVFVEKYWGNMLLVVFSGLVLTTLFIYGLGENCSC